MKASMPRTLLLATDGVSVHRVLELTLQEAGIRMLAVVDGEEAMARVATEHPDIVLADIALPKRSGYDVAASIKSDPGLRHIRVLLLASALDPLDTVRAEQVGSDGVIVMPFHPEDVVARVRELLDGVHATNAAPFADSKESIDAYFDRLGAALSRLEGRSLPPADSKGSRVPAVDDGPQVPTLEHLLGPGTPAASGGLAVDGRSPIAEAFSAWLAVEQGEPGAVPVRLVSRDDRPVVTDALVDEVTRRVLERLAPGMVRDVVAQVVSTVAERLVREEIERIRRGQGR